ncbi:MAG: leucine-rich repeat domain-containing protein [Oscillospiraceae bacterium]|nr:leucine-rich repeat domain-containing protein [Oscillospiraceae bacterium]
MKIRKILPFIFTAMISGSMSYSVNAEEYCDTLKYTIKDKSVVITGYSGSPKVLEIPSEIDGRKVVQIRENAFYKCESLERVVLPDTVEFVGHHAFFECTALESITVSDGVCSIGEGCFSGCINLSEVELSDSIRLIDDKSFFNCISLNKIEMPSSVEEIGDYAFSGTAVETVGFSGKLLNIGEGAFLNCESMGRVYIPESVINIGSCAFGYNGVPARQNHDFRISGTEKSLGRKYAETNGFDYENINEEKSMGKISLIPALGVVFSGAGLLFFNMINKIRSFKRKYEYEC